MATSDSTRKVKSANGFRISNGPMIRLGDEAHLHDCGDLLELPRLQGAPVLFAIARDPSTIFAYWEIDWPSIFENNAPADRQVHLRVVGDGDEETTTAVEPMAGSHYLQVAQPGGTYNVEIGYYQPQDVWNSVATSDKVTMPPNRVSENGDLDLTTLPFHLSFQRLIDLLRAAKSEALTEIVSRFQRRALSEQDRALLSPEESEILRAMKLSLEEVESASRSFNAPTNEVALRKRTEAVLGFGSTSPSRGFEGSSWS
ncbi:MAG: DUF4912 domain-containing protein [Verrucomicrobiota bacterium]